MSSARHPGLASMACFDRFEGDVQGELQVPVEGGLEEDGHGPAHDEARQDRTVAVPGDQDLVSGPGRGRHHGMVAHGRAVHEEVGAVRACRLGRQFLGFLDDAGRVLERIDLVEGRQVDGEDARPHELPEARGNTLAALVAGRMEGHLAALGQVDHGVEQGGAELLVLYAVGRWS